MIANDEIGIGDSVFLGRRWDGQIEMFTFQIVNYDEGDTIAVVGTGGQVCFYNRSELYLKREDAQKAEPKAW